LFSITGVSAGASVVAVEVVLVSPQAVKTRRRSREGKVKRIVLLVCRFNHVRRDRFDGVTVVSSGRGRRCREMLKVVGLQSGANR
jgi:hypothetical protein